MTQLKELYEELIRGFNSKPSDLKKCTVTLNKLKVSAIPHHSAPG